MSVLVPVFLARFLMPFVATFLLTALSSCFAAVIFIAEMQSRLCTGYQFVDQV